MQPDQTEVDISKTGLFKGIKNNSRDGGGYSIEPEGGAMQIPEPSLDFANHELMAQISMWLQIIGGGELTPAQAIKLDEKFEEIQNNRSLSDNERVYALMLRIELIRKDPSILMNRDPKDPDDEAKLNNFFVNQTGIDLANNERLVRLELGDFVKMLRDRGDRKRRMTKWGHRYHEYAFKVVEKFLPKGSKYREGMDGDRKEVWYKTGIGMIVFSEIWEKNYKGEDVLLSSTYNIDEDYDGSL